MKTIIIALLLVVCIAYVCAAPPTLTASMKRGLGAAFKRGREAFETVDDKLPDEIKRLKVDLGAAFKRGKDKFDIDSDAVNKKLDQVKEAAKNIKVPDVVSKQIKRFEVPDAVSDFPETVSKQMSKFEVPDVVSQQLKKFNIGKS